VIRGSQILRGLALASALLSTPACKVPDLLERARSPSDANLEPPPTDAVPAGPESVDVEDGADWIQLVSGEWLRGELLRVRDDNLDFDSDKLDLQTFDRDDVTRIHSAQTDFVVTDDNRVFAGRLVVDNQKVWVVGDRTVQIDRSELLAVVAAGDSDKGRLSGSINLGFAARSGNTDQVDLTGGASVLLERARSRAQAKYSGVISTVQDVETANNHRLTSTLDLYLTERTFVTVPGIELYRDKIQNIDLRTRPYAALGYKVIDTLDQKLRVSAGPAYQSTRLDAGATSMSSTDDTLAGVLSSDFDWDITGDIELTWSYSLTVPFPDTAQNNHNMVTSLSVDLTDDLELDVSFVWDRVNRPAANASGVVPLPNDFRTTVGVNWTF
jgi:putative salt-induced outer membrane protein YdiY